MAKTTIEFFHIISSLLPVSIGHFMQYAGQRYGSPHLLLLDAGKSEIDWRMKCMKFPENSSSCCREGKRHVKNSIRNMD